MGGNRIGILVKLNQSSLDNTIIIGMECLGRMENAVFLAEAGKSPDITERFPSDPALQDKVTTTYASCDAFVPENTDITLSTLGAISHGIGFIARSEKRKNPS